MLTRERAIEEQLASMAEQLARHDSVLSKLNSLCSTVQQHSESLEAFRRSNSESFELLRSSMASQQAMMAEMMAQLQKLDRGPQSTPQPPLLPRPSIPSLSMYHPHSPVTNLPLQSSNPPFPAIHCASLDEPPKLVDPIVFPLSTFSPSSLNPISPPSIFSTSALSSPNDFSSSLLSQSLPLPASVPAIAPSPGPIAATPAFSSSISTPAATPMMVDHSPPAPAVLDTPNTPPSFPRMEENVFDRMQAQGGGGLAATLLFSLISSHPLDPLTFDEISSIRFITFTKGLVHGYFSDMIDPGGTSDVIPRSLSPIAPHQTTSPLSSHRHPLETFRAIQSSNDCSSACLNDCSCIAYAYGKGCSIWEEELLNPQQLYEDGYSTTLYLLISASDIKHKKGKRRALPIILRVEGTIILLCILMEFAWRFQNNKMMRKRKLVEGPLLVGFCCVGYLDKAFMLFDEKNFWEMSANGVFPYVVTHSKVLDGYSKLGLIDEALHLYEEIQSDRVCSNTLLSIDVHIRKQEKIAGIGNEMDSVGFLVAVMMAWIGVWKAFWIVHSNSKLGIHLPMRSSVEGSIALVAKSLVMNLGDEEKLPHLQCVAISLARRTPSDFINQNPILHPTAILNRRESLRKRKVIQPVLVQWGDKQDVDAKWEDVTQIQKNFSNLTLEDKGSLEVGAIDAGTEDLKNGATIPGGKFVDFCWDIEWVMAGIISMLISLVWCRY